MQILMPTRLALHQQLDPDDWPHLGLSLLNKFILIAIVASVTIAILASEPTIAVGNERFFARVESLFDVLFTVEYIARVWTSVESPRYGTGLKGRVRYMLTPVAIFDLLALSPLFFPSSVGAAHLLRLVRLLRVLRLARLGRFSSAITLLSEAVRERRDELLTTVAFSFFILVVTSTLMYLVEGVGHPEAFGSIPRAMWWSVSALTTVGYGDVYPTTPVGKILSGLTSMAGVGIIALPTGILAAAFSNAVQRRRRLEMAEQEKSCDPE